jgi:hypothetical protein
MVAAGVSSAGCKVAVTGKRQPGAPAPATTSTNRRWAPVRAHRHRRHSRVAYAEIRDDEKAVTAIDVLRNAIAWFAQRGVTVERVLSDNGSAYKSFAWRDACTELGITVKKTRPYRPQTNGRVERFHRTLTDGWAIARHYNSELARRKALPAFLHHYNHHRPHSAIGGLPPITRLTNVVDQRPWTAHLTRAALSPAFSSACASISLVRTTTPAGPEPPPSCGPAKRLNHDWHRADPDTGRRTIRDHPAAGPLGQRGYIGTWISPRTVTHCNSVKASRLASFPP